MEVSAQEYIFRGGGNNRETGTSNDNDYYYCGRDVGKIVNQPPGECFPLMYVSPPVICQSLEHCTACLL